MELLGINQIDEGPVMQPIHKFGDHEEEKKASISVKFPFDCPTVYRDMKPTTKNLKFTVQFDVLEGDLPFLIGKPTLKAMKATINFEHMTLGIKFNNYYHRICLHDNGAHILLDFKASGNTYFSTPGAHNTSTYTGITSKPVYIRPEKNITPITPSKPASSSNQFDPKNLKKLHLQLKHGSHTAMREYLRAANYWRPEFDENISSLIEECGCIVANAPFPHAVVSSSPVPKSKQTHIGLDVV